jgi:hypothetical protein
MVQTILILAANPQGTSPLRLDLEVRAIDEGLRRSPQRDRFQIQQRWATRPRDVQRALLDLQPQIVHFCGHGEGRAGLVLLDETGRAKLVSTAALSGLFALFTNCIECVLLNACYAEVQANAIVEHINAVIGMRQAIKDDLAIAFSTGFYAGLGAGQSIEAAFQSGRQAIQQIVQSTGGDRKLIHVDATDTPLSPWQYHLIPVLKQKHQS